MSIPEDPGPMLGVVPFAELCGVSPWTVRTMIKQGILRAARVPGRQSHYRLPVDQADDVREAVRRRPEPLW